LIGGKVSGLGTPDYKLVVAEIQGKTRILARKDFIIHNNYEYHNNS